MSKMKKVLLMCTAYVLVAALAIGGTIAYLQDDDSDVNVMTLGNVKIEQHEYQRALNEDGTYKTATIDGRTSYVLEAFEQGKPILPIVGDPSSTPGYSYAGYDDITVRMSQVESHGGMQVFAGKNAVDKFVTVKNTGKTDAYVRTLVAVEIGTSDGSLVNWSARAAKPEENQNGETPWTEYEIGHISIDGNNYALVEFVYTGAMTSSGWKHEGGILPAGATTYPSVCQFYIKPNATNEDMDAIDGNSNGTLDIIVLSQAVQAAGFANAKSALDTAFGTSADKADEWFDGVAIPFPVATADELIAAVNAGKSVTLTKDIELTEIMTVTAANSVIDGNGHTLTSTAGRAVNVDCAGEVTIKNLTIAGGDGCERGINIINKAGVVNVEGVTITGDDLIIAVNAYLAPGATAAPVVNIKDCTLTTNMYTVQAYADGTVFNIEDSKITGWCALIVCEDNVKYNVKDSELIGIDTYANAEGQENAYSTIAINSGLAGIEINVEGGSITAQSNDGCETQFIIGHNGTVDVKANLDAELKLVGENTGYLNVKDGCEVTVRPEYAE